MDLNPLHLQGMDEPAPILPLFDKDIKIRKPSKKNLIDIGLKQRNVLFKCNTWSFDLWEFTLINKDSPTLVDIAMYILQRGDLPGSSVATLISILLCDCVIFLLDLTLLT
jgi:hypothetical protein